jgi:enamine deaminase RidA (YjgF/YER057c/UK114 family)
VLAACCPIVRCEPAVPLELPDLAVAAQQVSANGAISILTGRLQVTARAPLSGPNLAARVTTPKSTTEWFNPTGILDRSFGIETTEVTVRLVKIALALLIASASTAGLAGARQDAKVLMSTDPAALKFEQDWGFSDAIVTGDTVYLSGVVAGVRKGETDLRLGYTHAFERIGEILKNAGASWDDVVEITSFHTDLTTQMPAIVAVKNIYVKPPFPAWTEIQVSRLIPSDGITEIRIVAKLRK